jgi:hypothetical protein
MTSAARAGTVDDAFPYTREVGRSEVRGRVGSLDIVRGMAMILMAIDHVRVYSGLPPGGPTPGIFFTRWVAHFVAPAFVFLAGTGAYLHGRKLGDVAAALSRFLLTRGLVSLIRDGRIDPWLFGNHPMDPGPAPPGYAWSLPLLYLVFAICVCALYVPCRWFARMKRESRSPWLSYL